MYLKIIILIEIPCILPLFAPYCPFHLFIPKNFFHFLYLLLLYLFLFCFATVVWYFGARELRRQTHKNVTFIMTHTSVPAIFLTMVVRFPAFFARPVAMYEYYSQEFLVYISRGFFNLIYEKIKNSARETKNNCFGFSIMNYKA